MHVVPGMRVPRQATGGTTVSTAQRLSALAELPTDDLADRAVTVARKAAAEGAGSPARAELGLLLVALRSRFTDAEDRPDFAGRSRAYRDLVTSVFDTAGLAGAIRTNVSKASRRAVGTILRDVLTTDEIRDYGLLHDGPVERQRAASRAQWMPAAVAREMAAHRPTDAAPDVLRLATGALGILRRIDEGAVDALDATDRATLARLAAQMEDTAYAIRMWVTDDE